MTAHHGYTAASLFTPAAPACYHAIWRFALPLRYVLPLSCCRLMDDLAGKRARAVAAQAARGHLRARRSRTRVNSASPMTAPWLRTIAADRPANAQAPRRAPCRQPLSGRVEYPGHFRVQRCTGQRFAHQPHGETPGAACNSSILELIKWK